MKDKIFCIGLHKTGTSSLQKALEILGLKVLWDYNYDVDYFTEDKIKSLLKYYDSVRDVPFAYYFKELDQWFPDSKFILTRRNVDEWIKSAVNHFGDDDIINHKIFYGTGVIKGNEDLYVKKYREHNAEVIKHFKGTNQLLVLDNELSGEEKWEKIGAFLNKEVNTTTPFPHENKKR